MPTGYTTCIYDNKNVTFTDFVLMCARAFGPCSHQRDDDLRDKPTLRKLDIQYHLDAIADAEKMGKCHTKETFEAYKQEMIAEFEAMCSKKDALRQRYNNLLDQVKAWQPPTDKHVELKKFMIEQLEISINWDCAIYNYDAEINSYKNMEYEHYVQQIVESAKKDIEYHTQCIDAEKRKVEFDNNWIIELINSLNLNDPAKNPQ